MNDERKELTKAEEQIMQVLWRKEKSFVKEILAELPEPKPAYNTVSTIVRILVEKQFVGYNAYGKSHQYYPLISKSAYSKDQVNTMVSRFFDNSPKRLLSYLLKSDKLDVNDIDEIMKELKKNK
jgi:predicted transcriptional regulator